MPLIWNPDPRTLVFCNLLCGVGFGVCVFCPSQICTNFAANLILISFLEVHCLQLEAFFSLDAILIFHCKGLAACGLLAERVRTRYPQVPQVWAFLKYMVISAGFHKVLNYNYIIYVLIRFLVNTSMLIAVGQLQILLCFYHEKRVASFAQESFRGLVVR